MLFRTVRWLYKLDADFTWETHRYPSLDHDFRFYDSDDHLRLTIDKAGVLTVTKDYAWNGCSPKYALFDILLGTPEGATSHKANWHGKTYYASCVHDALYQFLESGLPLTRKEADHVFLNLLQQYEFKLARAYWLAVRCFGRFVHFAKKRVRKWDGSCA